MAKRPTISYDNITSRSLNVSGVSTLGIVSADGISTDTLISESSLMTNAIARNLSVSDILITPVSVVRDTGVINLSNTNSGQSIDANDIQQQYRLVIDSSLQIGNGWKISINSIDPVLIDNQSGRDISLSGMRYTSSIYEYVNAQLIPDGSTITLPGNKILYDLSVTSLTDTQVRMMFDGIIIQQP